MLKECFSFSMPNTCLALIFAAAPETWKQHLTCCIYAKGSSFLLRTLTFSCVFLQKWIPRLCVCVFACWACIHTTPLSLSCQCLSDWHMLFLKVNLNLRNSGLRCSHHQRSNLTLLTSIKFPLLAAEPSFLIILHVVETGTWRSRGIHV